MEFSTRGRAPSPGAGSTDACEIHVVECPRNVVRHDMRTSVRRHVRNDDEGMLTERDWQIILKVKRFFISFYETIKILSGVYYPTSCMSKLKTLYITMADQATDKSGGSAQNDGWHFNSGRKSGPDGKWDYQWGTGSDRNGNTFGFGSGSSQPGQQGDKSFGYGWSGSTSPGGNSAGGSFGYSGNGGEGGGGGAGAGTGTGGGEGGGGRAPSGQPAFGFELNQHSLEIT
ncbi:putative glycine-rich cell wall structural protein 1 [Olea europaea var. sylvestris]|uniref:putative glycine-rich cell wall structural protein 1 n=1 Tax=Olea europaea var. sylvestris TaxID=158386 RepID=UPI000C1D717F|nr:putative glycine-rich cell wall structural protein 1 [Olea europaea var. sylvestris]